MQMYRKRPRSVGSSEAIPYCWRSRRPTDKRRRGTSEYYNGAHSNYNGGSVTYKHIDNKGVTADVTYTT